jgi:ribosomal protein S18 acetylase RimI-like enzyme
VAAIKRVGTEVAATVPDVRVDLRGTEQAQAHADEVFAVYDAVFSDWPDQRSWRDELYDRHCAREGFRLSAALAGGRLTGFAWGYVGQRGQHWSDLVVKALPADVTDFWVGGHFELAELAVLPDARRRGVGGRLHDVLLEGIAQPRAMLSTDNFDSPAVRLYAGRGWRKLGELDADTQVMGLLPPGKGDCGGRDPGA